MAENEIKFVGDSQSLERAQEKIVAGENKITDAIVKTTAASKESASEKRRLDSAALKLMREMETEEEKKKRRLAEIAHLYETGRIPVEKYNLAVQKIGAEHVNATKAVEATTDSMENLGNVGQSSMSGMIQSMAGAAGSLLSLRELVQALIAEYKHLIELQEKSRNASIDYQAAMQDLRMNFEADETVGWEDLDHQVMGISRQAGVPVAVAAQALGGALSTKGEKSNQWAIDTTLSALQITRSPEDAAALSEATGDFSRMGESQDSKAIQGFLSQAQKASIIKSTPQLSKQSASAVAAGQKLGLSVEEAMELFAGVGNQMNDKTGELTKTAMITFFDQLGGGLKLNSQQKKDKDIAGQYEQFKSLPKDANQRIQFLRENPKFQSAFIENMTGGAQANVALQELITNTEKWQKEINTVREQIPSMSAAVDAANRQSFDETSTNVRGLKTPQGRIADADARSKANLEIQDLLRAEIEGSIGGMREIFKKTIENDNLKGPDQLVKFAQRQSLWIKETFQNSEDALFGEMQGLRTYVQDQDLPVFDEQLKEMERLKEAIKRSRNMVPADLPGKPLSPVPAQNDPTDTRSRYGKPNPELNDRGAYEGTVQEPSVSSVTPMFDEAKLGRAVSLGMVGFTQQLLQAITGLSSDTQSSLRALAASMQKQTDTIAQNRPRPRNPLDFEDRRFRDGTGYIG